MVASLLAPQALHFQLARPEHLTKGRHSSVTVTMSGSISLPATGKSKYEGDIICASKDTTLRAELETIKNMLNASDRGADIGAVNKTLFEVIRECIPSDSPLSSFLDNRSRKSTMTSLVSNGYAPHAVHKPQDVWDTVDKIKPQRDHVLILRDIDSDWCEALSPDTLEQ